MTVAAAWVGRRKDGREHLYIASDSRVSGGQRLDACPKIITLPRSDCALCFAGDTATTYPLMIQLGYAIAAHEPARERNLDIARVNAHLLRVFSDVVNRITDAALPFAPDDAQFLFAGYSWLSKDFRIWTIYYDPKQRRFRARDAVSFHNRLRKAAFVGDWAKRLRAEVVRSIREPGPHVYLEPLRTLAEMLQGAPRRDTIGGPPQIVRITAHMSTRPLCVRWNDEDTLFGRPLFDYENVDYWIVDPFTGQFARPRKFGHRPGTPAAETDEDDAHG
jgi:hypothetical protein